jgi:hypothetical protein
MKMKGSVYEFLATALLVVAVCIHVHTLFKLYGPFREELSECDSSHQFPGQELTYEALDSVQGECYFKPSFAQATELFMKSAELAGAELSSMEVTESLHTRVAIIRGDPNSYLLHISGIHGVEGPAGSAIQSATLQFLKNDHERMNRKDFPTVVFVHAVNPYGFENNRRVNEDNIDMNRNFLTEEEFAAFQRRDPNFSGYVDQDHTLNPTTKPSTNQLVNDVYTYGLALKTVIQYGYSSVKRAMVAGNYHKQKGIFFGGFEMARGSKNLVDLVQNKLRIPHTASKVVLIDVHTGLGPEGVDTLLMSPPTAQTVDAISAFPAEFSPKGAPTGGLKEAGLGPTDQKQGEEGAATGPVSAGYDLTAGTVSEGFCEHFLAPHLNSSNRICVTQEFGTVPGFLVGTSMINENYAFHHGSSESEKQYYSGLFSSCFNVKRVTWQRSVVKRGVRVFLQALDLLDKLPPGSIGKTGSD